MQHSSTLATLALLASVLVPATFNNPQRFTGTGPNPLPVGQPLNITYTNQMQANATITVKIYSSANPEDAQTIEITADENGVASATFEVPIDWAGAVLTNPNSADYTVPVAWDV